MLAILKPEHKSLEVIWYQKLKEDGFKDIEDTSMEGRPLLCWHNFKFKNIPNIKIESSKIYYEKAKTLLMNHIFENETEKTIWSLHSEGLSKRQIEKVIQNSEKPYKREMIGKIINKIIKAMK